MTSKSTTSDSNISNLSGNFKRCSQFPTLGTCKISYGAANPEKVQDFLSLISKVVEEVARDSEMPFNHEGVSNVQDTDVSWSRWAIKQVFPFYIESITIAPVTTESDEEVIKVAPGFPGQWVISPDIFDPEHDDFFWKHQGKWIEWVHKQVAQRSCVGGLSCNVLEIAANSLKSGDVDVRPLTLHAISPDGRGVDRGNPEAQAAIANSFWQTFWATGATRTERGSVFPVAFLPVDRSSKYEFAEPFHERYVSLRRRLFGRSAIVNYVLEVLTGAGALLFDVNTSTFSVSSKFDVLPANVASADILLAVEELNRTGFIDAYTGTNKETFCLWVERERQLNAGEPWPYESSNWNGKVKAAGHGKVDFLEAIRLDPSDPGAVVVNRIVPYAGSAYLYQVMSHTEELRKSGKIQDFDGELIGATNSTFFLNFPEEYSALHSAMNEPVSLLVENGVTHQIRTLRRAAFVLSESGDAFITSRAGNKLNSDVLVFEGESSSATFFEKAEKSFRENTFGPLFFGAAVVGDSIVETFEEIATDVPPAGWMIGDSEAFGGRIEPAHAAEAQIRRPGTLQEVDIRHAFAIGPLLVQAGQVVPLEESREEFASIKLSKAMTFDETSVLPRTKLPDALLNCEARGVPPTRFPYDWNVTRAPRSAIGVKSDGSVIIAVVDGRADLSHSVGATLAELAEIMTSLGCVDAMNMDGGGSSVMFVNSPEAAGAKLRPDLRNGIVNLPSDMGGVERMLPVPLVVYKRQKLDQS